ncbi:hypothetical protein [Limnohabitans sp.]|jgi:hypothetical protein|uniref:hypothetical protein n=1 Tax=Limnohabitans sp. TaxID=1907725 RepID=UPI0025C62CF4|nr:hypothetical protein [Limnohabitans sp.]
MSPFKTALLLLTASLLSGCASVLTGDSQDMRVTTYCGQQTIPASCVASNSKGSWPFFSPANIVVQKDRYSLTISCKSPYFAEGVAHVPSTPNPMVAGNLVFGGLIGAGVDMVTGAGFAYNSVVNIHYPSCR